MKKIIRLTESDLTRIIKRVINEQMTAIEMLGSIPETGQDVVGINTLNDNCLDHKTDKEIILELFMKARKQPSKPNIYDKAIVNWAKRLNNAIKGVGASNDVYTVFSEIKTLPQLGSVLDYYQKAYKTYLYSDLSSEYTITWSSLWQKLQKFNKVAGISFCNKYAGTQT